MLVIVRGKAASGKTRFLRVLSEAEALRGWYTSSAVVNDLQRMTGKFLCIDDLPADRLSEVVTNAALGHYPFDGGKVLVVSLGSLDPLNLHIVGGTDAERADMLSKFEQFKAR